MNSDNKIISLEEALSFIKSGDHVVTGLGAGEAMTHAVKSVEPNLGDFNYAA